MISSKGTKKNNGQREIWEGKSTILQEWARARFQNPTADVEIRVLPLGDAVFIRVLGSLSLNVLIGETEMIIMMPI